MSMGVYIKDMEMPINCCECPLTYYEDGTCIFTGIEALSIGVQKDCPLVPVPKHGRLIDADALAKTLGITDMDCFKCAWGGNHGLCGRGGDFTDACEAIEEAPTVIPADPADKEGET